MRQTTEAEGKRQPAGPSCRPAGPWAHLLAPSFECRFSTTLGFASTLSIARLSLYSNISSYSARSNVHGMSGRHCVSVVLIRSLPTIAPYIPGYVVDRGCDTPIESFVVNSPNIGQIGSSYEGRHALFLIFLSNIPYV